jgi:DNA-binding transcriptional ArsR family regulator
MNMSSDVEATVTPDECEVRLVDPTRVSLVSASMPSRQMTASLADVFGLLSDSNRLRLLLALREGGELCVCDLAASVEISESATSHALRLLRTAHVVKVSRIGRMAYYSLVDDHVRQLLDVALEHVSHE